MASWGPMCWVGRRDGFLKVSRLLGRTRENICSLVSALRLVGSMRSQAAWL